MIDLKLHSDLTFATVTEQQLAVRKFIENAPANTPMTIDLSAVQRSDSAGLAIMIEALRLSRQLKKNIAFKSIPTQMNALMRFCDILPLFE